MEGYRCHKKRKGVSWAAIALAFALGIVCMGERAHAQEPGEAYVTTVAALKSASPAQKLSVTVCGYTFEKTMAELGAMEVVVSDNADGTRLCHIPDTALLDGFLSDINTALSGAPVDGAFYYYDEATLSFQTYPGASCYRIGEAGKGLVYQTFLSMLADNGNADASVVLPTETLELTVMDVPEEILRNRYSLEGSCTTSLKGSSANRIGNVALAVSHIDHMVLYPGQEVSMSEAFTPRTYENGYRLAGAYSGGRLVQAIGGGICQASSTIYNAAMNSGLTVLERHPHSMPVHYLPLGMDAAISSGSKDLRLRNDYPFPVLLEGYVEGKNVTVNIYTNDLLTTGVSYRLHAVNKGSLAGAAYLEVSVNGEVVEDRYLGTSRYSAMRSDEEEAED